jgi:hypothetical protein
VHHSEAALTAQQAERIVGWALSTHLSSGADMALPPKAARDSPAAPLAVPSACLQAALATHLAAQVQRLRAYNMNHTKSHCAASQPPWLHACMHPVPDGASAVSQAAAAPAAQRFKEIGDLNDFEKKLLEEVRPQCAG